MSSDHPLNRIVAEAMALATLVAPFVHALPDIGSLVGLVWYGVLLHDRFRRKKP